MKNKDTRHRCSEYLSKIDAEFSFRGDVNSRRKSSIHKGSFKCPNEVGLYQIRCLGVIVDPAGFQQSSKMAEKRAEEKWSIAIVLDFRRGCSQIRSDGV